jgi:hypothetical protein
VGMPCSGKHALNSSEYAVLKAIQWTKQLDNVLVQYATQLNVGILVRKAAIGDFALHVANKLMLSSGCVTTSTLVNQVAKRGARIDGLASTASPTCVADADPG